MAGNNGARGGSLRVIGKPLRKVDATSKCTGQTKYADDIVFPRMLHTKLLRSTVPHARIVRIDTSKAEKELGFRSRYPLGEGIRLLLRQEAAVAKSA
jgi:xanthine dehydrogenase molybdopterin-binding subunit B